MNTVVAQVARAVAHMLKLSSRLESEVAGPEITSTIYKCWEHVILPDHTVGDLKHTDNERLRNRAFVRA